MQRKHLAVIGLVLVILSGCQKKAEEANVEDAADTAAVADGGAPVRPVDLVPCEIIGRRRVTQEDCDLAKAADDDVKNGVAAFNWPQVMRREKPVMLRLAIGKAASLPPQPAVVGADAAAEGAPTESAKTESGKTESATANSEGAAATPPAPQPEPAPTPETAVESLSGEVVSYKPLVGQYMSAKLSGDSFDIVAQSDEHQEVLRDSITHWDWLVTPKAGGPHTLTITTQVEFKDSAGAYIPLRFRPETREIEVKVPWWLWVKDTLDALPGWIKAITAVVAALAALAGAWVGLRTAVKGKAPAADAG